MQSINFDKVVFELPLRKNRHVVSNDTCGLIPELQCQRSRVRALRRLYRHAIDLQWVGVERGFFKWRLAEYKKVNFQIKRASFRKFLSKKLDQVCGKWRSEGSIILELADGEVTSSWDEIQIALARHHF